LEQHTCAVAALSDKHYRSLHFKFNKVECLAQMEILRIPIEAKGKCGKVPFKITLLRRRVCVWVFFAPHSWVRTHLLGATIYKKIPIELWHRWANVFRPIKSHPARALIMKNHIESTGSAHADSGRR